MVDSRWTSYSLLTPRTDDHTVIFLPCHIRSESLSDVQDPVEVGGQDGIPIGLKVLEWGVQGECGAIFADTRIVHQDVDLVKANSISTEGS